MGNVSGVCDCLNGLSSVGPRGDKGVMHATTPAPPTAAAVPSVGIGAAPGVLLAATPAAVQTSVPSAALPAAVQQPTPVAPLTVVTIPSAPAAAPVAAPLPAAPAYSPLRPPPQPPVLEKVAVTSSKTSLQLLVDTERPLAAATKRFCDAEGEWMSVMGVWTITLSGAQYTTVDAVSDPRPSARARVRSLKLQTGDVVTVAELYRQAASSGAAAGGVGRSSWRDSSGWCRITKIQRGTSGSTECDVVVWAKESAAFRATEAGCECAFYEKADPPFALPAVVLEKVAYPRDDASQNASEACAFKHLRSAGWDNRFFQLAFTADEDKFFRGCAALPKQFALGKSLTTDTSKPAVTPRTPGGSRQQGPRAWQFGYGEDSFLKISYSDMLCQGNVMIEAYQAWQAAKKTKHGSDPGVTKDLQRKYERLKRTMPPPEKLVAVMERLDAGGARSLADAEIVTAPRLQELMPEWDAKSCTRFIEYCISTGVDADHDGRISGAELKAQAAVRLSISAAQPHVQPPRARVRVVSSPPISPCSPPLNSSPSLPPTESAQRVHVSSDSKRRSHDRALGSTHGFCARDQDERFEDGLQACAVGRDEDRERGGRWARASPCVVNDAAANLQDAPRRGDDELRR